MIEGHESGVAGGSLLERDVAVGAIGDAIGAVGRGGGEVLFIVGTAGIGKTSVLAAGRVAARTEGFQVAGAVGSQMEVGLPFGLFSQAVAGLGGAGGEAAVGFESFGVGDQSARFYRTLRWLGEVAGRAPVLLALDDLHWSDPDSLALLGFVCRRSASSRVLVLGSLRPQPGPACALVQELVAANHARVVELAALSPQASGALVARIASRSLDAAQSDRLWRACAGTPLLLEAAARVLKSEGSLDVGRGDTLGQAFLLQRFSGLGEEAFGYVQAASVLGVRFRPGWAAALAGLDPAAAQRTHALLVRSRLLDDLGGNEASFVHPLFAQALLEDQPLSERERHHADAFRLLVDQGAPDAVAAEHAVAAGLLGDRLAIEVCSRAGRAALAEGALEAASTHLANAVELAGEVAADALLLDYASALGARARLDQMERICRRLLARAELDFMLRARALALLARGALIAGRPSDAERLYEQAAAAAALVDPASEATILVDAAITCQICSPISWVSKVTSRALASIPTGAPARRTIEMIDAYVSLLGADPSQREHIVSEARRWDQRAGDGDSGWAWTLAVHALNAFKLLEDLDGATELFEREFERAVDDGAPILINALAVAYADAVHRLGRPQEALELVERADALTDWPMAPWVDLARVVLLTELGRDEEARPTLNALHAFQSSVPPEYYAPVSLWLDLIEGRRLLAAGEAEQASATMLHAAMIARLTGWREPCIVPWAAVGIDAHLAAGRIDRARVLVNDLERLTRRLTCRWPRAVIALGHARPLAADGRTGEADRRFGQALALFEELPMPIHRADALISHGIHLRGVGRPREARGPLARGLAIAEGCGAERVARIGRTELAAAGGRRRRQQDDPRTLTAQEERVAALAAQGLSNKQIAAALHLSPRTVGHHLQHVYAKLDLRSRRELIVRRAERG